MTGRTLLRVAIAGAAITAIAATLPACRRDDPLLREGPISSPPGETSDDGQLGEAGSGGIFGGSPPPVGVQTLMMASPFDGPVCGRWNSPDPGCEFGVEGMNETGDWGCRTGSSCLKQDRFDQTDRPHVGVIREVPLPDGSAFIGAAFRVDEIPETAPGFIELMQMSPTDGAAPIRPVDVRLYRTGQLGLALFQTEIVGLTSRRISPGEWFYVIAEIGYGRNVPHRMWVYDEDDRFTDSVEIPLSTAVPQFAGKHRARQKIGGVTAALRPGTYSYADDWYIAQEFLGPLHIDEPVNTPLADFEV